MIRAARGAAEPASLNGEARDQRLHAWIISNMLICECQVKQARPCWRMNALPPFQCAADGDYALAAIPPARRSSLAIGTGRYIEGEEGACAWAEAITWAAIGEGSARSGNLDRAAKAERLLRRSRRDAKQTTSTGQTKSKCSDARCGMIAENAGTQSDAISKMRFAVELERAWTSTQ